MDAQQFLAEFGYILRAPGGILRLRELILTFAVRGRLVSQAFDESKTAHTVRSLISKRKKNEAKTRFRVLDEIKSGEAPYEIPDNWLWIRLGEVVEILDGLRRPITKQNRDAGPYPYYGASGIVDYVADFIFDEQLILVGEDGAKWGCGENSAFKISGKTWVNNHAHVVRPLREFILDDYLVYSFVEMDLSPFITGMTVPKLNQARLISIPLPLPPLEEQARIVAKVDELMALCDKLEIQQKEKTALCAKTRHSALAEFTSSESPLALQENWTRLHKNLALLIDSVDAANEMKSAIRELTIRGLLAPICNDTVDSFLAEIQGKKQGKRFAKQTKPSEDFDLPKGWKWVLLEDLLGGSDSGWSPKCDSEQRKDNEWGVLKVSAVTWGRYQPNENKKLPSSLEARPEFEVADGDFLMSRANTAEFVARSVIVPDNSPSNLMMSDKIVRLEFLDDRVKPWVNLVNNSAWARSYYKANATGTSDSMRNVSRQVIHELAVPLPPLELQFTLLNILASLENHCDLLASQIAEADKISNLLASSAIAAITGIRTEEEEALKTPKTELISKLRLANNPDIKEQAPLAAILARHQSEMSAGDLWQRYGGEIDAFYAQLKQEVGKGWIAEPAIAQMRETEKG